jgi:2',3'-cyclic-nucleotide 2'-phosphodiesterase (5'-nucleotidase family)/predicted AlkP superfamily phosphohydrolase/phosphomutase
MTRKAGPVWALVALSIAVTVAVAVGGSATAANDSPWPLTNKMIMFASDGMRPDLMEKYAKAGSMPTYKKLMSDGATGDNGMLQAFPPNTGVGWYTMATGTYPSEHGSTNNTFFRSGDTFSNRTSFSATGVLQADTIANAAERAGKKVAQIDWVGGAAANINGPTVDFTNFFSNRGVLVGVADPVEQAGSAFFGVTYQVATVVPAAGWAGVPTGDPAATPKETTWTINSTFAAQNPNRTYNVYFYDSVTGGGVNYDHAIVSPVGKTGAAPSIDLKVGDFLPVKLIGANGLIGTRVGQTVGHYVKLISLAPDASQFKLYDTSLARAIAKCGTPCAGLPAGGSGEDRLEKYIADNLLPWAAADFAPEEAGVVDEETYVEQGRDLERAYSLQVINYILGTLQPDTNLALVGYPFTDEVSHQFMALVSPTDADGALNPCYDVNPKFDDVQCTGRGTAGRVAIREGYIRSAYQDADEKLGITRGLMGGNPTTVAASDHGFAPQWYAVNANKVLNAATVDGISLHASNASASNCSAAVADLTKACWAGGTIQIYVNSTLPAGTTYAEVRAAVRTAFQSLTDPANPGKQVIARIMDKEELRNVDGSDSLHPNRSGDVVVVTRPPYQSDAGTPNVAIALSHFFGQHGYLPDYVDLENNINMHATFVAAGPGIRKQDPVAGVRAIDLAPTIAFLMDIPGPQNARGKILTKLTPTPGQYKELTILGISDYHGQLVPLSEASDSFGPSFGIGGSAFLKTWFDVYRAEAPGGSITVAAGDSVGATPPISSFFGDTPTIELMNMMGFSADGLGNHNFDKGQAYLRNTLIPLAQFPYLSANVVGANGKTPAEWSPSKVFDIFDAAKLGLVGFTNEDAPTLVFPNAFAPFTVQPRISRVQAEVNALKAKRIGPIVVMGHDGATGGTLTNPTGPLVDLANGVTGVDVLIGDHTDFQVSTMLNGILVVENRSKGIRFTRVRLIVDTNTKKVVYKTADFHKPWNIGITPDAAIQARIDQLTAQLAPILGIVIGSSNVEILRSDACGQSAGRTCESKVGNAVTDALRLTYGTEFALTNSGGLRDRLTCPPAGGGSGFCPAFTPPPHLITRGQVLTVLPFGNVAVTLTVTGAELKSMLERGVSAMPAADGRFPQISGLCFTYDITAPASSRVTGAVRQAADGSCTGLAINLTGGSYTLTSNDFTASGGDGYPSFVGRFTTRDIMDQAVADFIDASTPPGIGPTIQGRIVCTDSNGATAPNCPVVVP